MRQKKRGPFPVVRRLSRQLNLHGRISVEERSRRMAEPTGHDGALADGAGDRRLQDRPDTGCFGHWGTWMPFSSPLVCRPVSNPEVSKAFRPVILMLSLCRGPTASCRHQDSQGDLFVHGISRGLTKSYEALRKDKTLPRPESMLHSGMVRSRSAAGFCLPVVTARFWGQSEAIEGGEGRGEGRRKREEARLP